METPDIELFFRNHEVLDPSYKSGIVESFTPPKPEEFDPKTDNYDERKGGKESSVSYSLYTGSDSVLKLPSHHEALKQESTTHISGNKNFEFGARGSMFSLDSGYGSSNDISSYKIPSTVIKTEIPNIPDKKFSTFCGFPNLKMTSSHVNSSDEVFQDFDVTIDFDKISMNKIDSTDTVATVNREVCEVVSDEEFLKTQRNKRGDRLIKRYEELDDDEEKHNPVEGIEVLEVLETFEESNRYETKDPELVVCPVEMEVKVGLQKWTETQTTSSVRRRRNKRRKKFHKNLDDIEELQEKETPWKTQDELVELDKSDEYERKETVEELDSQMYSPWNDPTSYAWRSTQQLLETYPEESSSDESSASAISIGLDYNDDGTLAHSCPKGPIERYTFKRMLKDAAKDIKGSFTKSSKKKNHMGETNVVHHNGQSSEVMKINVY